MKMILFMTIAGVSSFASALCSSALKESALDIQAKMAKSYQVGMATSMDVLTVNKLVIESKLCEAPSDIAAIKELSENIAERFKLTSIAYENGAASKVAVDAVNAEKKSLVELCAQTYVPEAKLKADNGLLSNADLQTLTSACQ